MASPAVAPAPAAAPHVLPQQHDQRHYTLPHHAYTPQSGPRSSTGTLQSHLRQQSLPSHAYDQILPAKPKPAARRLDGVQTPLTEENIAALQRQSHTHILNSPPSSRKAPVRPHSPTANTRSSRGSRQSQLRDSGVGSPVRQISDTPRGLSSDPEKQEALHAQKADFPRLHHHTSGTASPPATSVCVCTSVGRPGPS
ncbi:hypothetical protein FH972_021790 [Carpinus fangiana]|uniref:Uncharacterized protein n=1 Tax=Carpinus fangiana TaxID=176857 RepID=A0A5N6KQB6_9ROSI|nr:hypothetical protein FH972_021790 [Carpinus fangiana]